MASLRNCTVVFHTYDDDKDDDTHVTVTVRDSNNTIAARIDSDFYHFDDQSSSGPFALRVLNRSSKDALQTGNVTIRIDPNGHDTWKFSFMLVLHFNDGSTFSASSERLTLSQNRDQYTTGIDGLKPA